MQTFTRSFKSVRSKNTFTTFNVWRYEGNVITWYQKINGQLPTCN